MVIRRPLVLNNGLVSDLLDGDTVKAGVSTTEVVAGSGLTGGGSVSLDPRLDVAIAPNPSGVIFVGNDLGLDGVTQVLAETALASGSAAAVLASNALASGNDSLAVAEAALASGNAALELIPSLQYVYNSQYVAAGPVTSGYPVGLDDTGRVQPISVSITPSGLAFSNPGVTFEQANVTASASIYVPVSKKIVITYADAGNGGYATAIVGTVSGSIVSFGSPVVIRSAASNTFKLAASTVREQIVAAYNDSGSNVGLFFVGVLEGNSISFGPFTSLGVSGRVSPAVSYDPENDKYLVSYTDGANSSYGTSAVGTVTNDRLTLAAAVVFKSLSTALCDNTYDSLNKKHVVSYRNGSNTRGEAIVCTVSGTTPLFGTFTQFSNPVNTTDISSTYDSNKNNVIVSYRDSTNTRGEAVVGTVSGTSISFGTPVTFASINPAPHRSIYDSLSDRVVLSYRNGTSTQGESVVGVVSGTTISFDSPVVFNSSDTNTVSSAYDPGNNRVVVAYRADAASGVAILADPLSTYIRYPQVNSKNNVLGISNSTVVSGDVCSVSLPGVIYTDPTNSLTTGKFYYPDVVTSGLTTSPDQPYAWEGQVPWNYIGRAISSSGLMILKSI